MKKLRLLALFCAVLLLSSCGAATVKPDSNETDATLHATATTYPVYLMAQAVTQDVPGVEVSLVINQQISCLHDYTLTTKDMEAVEQADVVLLSGAGLEDFLGDVLEGRTSIDCSENIALRYNEAEGEDDPHIWMAPENAAQMAQNIAAGLAAIDPDHADAYQANADAAQAELTQFRQELLDELGGKSYGLITFHDGFGYFADSFGLELLAAVEEEEGSEASAKTINEITALVREHNLPAIFTEVNGSDATAQAICRECGIETYPLSMCMSGDGGGLAAYEAVIRGNIETILEAFA